MRTLSKRPLENPWREQLPKLRDSIMGHLYGRSNQKFQDEVDAIAIEHRSIRFRNGLAYSHLGFIYKNTTYFHKDEKEYSVYHLIPELHERMEEALKLKHLIQPNEPIRVSSFITKTMNHSSNVAEFVMLYPTDVRSSLFNMIKIDQASINGFGDTAEAFINDHEDEYALIKQRLLYNLLLD